MKKYMVKLTYTYCETVAVEADSEDEAIEKAKPEIGDDLCLAGWNETHDYFLELEIE